MTKIIVFTILIAAVLTLAKKAFSKENSNKHNCCCNHTHTTSTTSKPNKSKIDDSSVEIK